ncbi:hypothetical protein [Actinacidiphila sp. bgisy160]|uniref:hypothetical protein n=1 Tax=Actinacidiphila sp. bgisy160 TaxID=3413796 RepID=UPI003D71D15A
MDWSQYTGPTNTREAEDRRTTEARTARRSVTDTVTAAVLDANGGRKYATARDLSHALDDYARTQAATGPAATCPGTVASVARAMAISYALYERGTRYTRTGISRTFGDFVQGSGPYQLTIRADDLLITCHDGGAYGPLPDSGWDRPADDVAAAFLAWTEANPHD